MPSWITKLPLEQQADALQDWQERVAIMHYDGGLKWAEAERQASELVKAYYVRQMELL